MKDIKVGDIVHVRGEVRCLSDTDDKVRISFKGDTVWNWCPPEIIVHVEPRPIKVGDRVVCGGNTAGEVIAIHRDWAWVDWPETNGLVRLVGLTRIEGEPS